MRRRSFVKAAGLSTLALSTFKLWADKTSMNLLIIHTDEHNFRTLGCYRNTLPKEQALMWGESVVETPHIDWIAKNGALCTGFYAATPVCSPSRSSFLTGYYPQNTPVITNDIPMKDGIITFAEILIQQGYETGYAGKWHLDGKGKPQWAPERKFGFEDNRYMFNRGHWKQLEDTPDGPRVAARRNNEPTYSVRGANEKNFTTDFLADKTVEFINKNKAKPFCYMVSIPDPHGPNSVRAPYNTMYKKAKLIKPRTFDKPDDNIPDWGKKKLRRFNKQQMIQYYGMVKCIDDNVGKILKSLEENNLIKKTIVIFTSDHGDLCGEHARDNKGVPYEASAKIPFLIYFPGKIGPGIRIDEVLNCVDFFPTIINMMGFLTIGKEEGRDASTLFTTGKPPEGWKDITFMRGISKPKTERANWIAAVTKRYKLVFAPRDDPWLFDLQKDPDEVTNFFSDPEYREIIWSLSK